MKHNSNQASNSDEWAATWSQLRRDLLKQIRQQALELRMQEADPRVIARQSEARSYLVASLQSLEVASHQHAATIRQRLAGTGSKSRIA